MTRADIRLLGKIVHEVNAVLEAKLRLAAAMPPADRAAVHVSRVLDLLEAECVEFARTGDAKPLSDMADHLSDWAEGRLGELILAFPGAGR